MPNIPIQENATRRDVSQEGRYLVQDVTTIHNDSVARPNGTYHRKSAPWWTPDIASLRKTAIRLNRVHQRKRKRHGSIASEPELLKAKNAKRELTNAINKAKTLAWEYFCNQLDWDPRILSYRKAYRLLMDELLKLDPTIGFDLPSHIIPIIKGLFPEHPKRNTIQKTPECYAYANEIAIASELQETTLALKPTDFLSPYGIPNEMTKIIADNCPDILSSVFNESTIDMIKHFKNIVNEPKYEAGLQIIDVHNDSNSVPWTKLIKIVTEKDILKYLCQIINNYFFEKSLMYDVIKETDYKSLSSKVPQGSVLGPTMWSILYNDLLRLSLLEEVEFLVFSNNNGIIASSEYDFVLDKKLITTNADTHFINLIVSEPKQMYNSSYCNQYNSS